ncbi:MAG: carbohydrate-binding protein [Deltaproteobacteria bacterium]|nr:carbohydrate-binding protein [Deltaproteobacteria bacterium]
MRHILSTCQHFLAVLSAALILSLFTGCQRNTSKDAAGITDITVLSAADAGSNEKTTLQIAAEGDMHVVYRNLNCGAESIIVDDEVDAEIAVHRSEAWYLMTVENVTDSPQTVVASIAADVLTLQTGSIYDVRLTLPGGTIISDYFSYGAADSNTSAVDSDSVGIETDPTDTEDTGTDSASVTDSNNTDDSVEASDSNVQPETDSADTDDDTAITSDVATDTDTLTSDGTASGNESDTAEDSATTSALDSDTDTDTDTPTEYSTDTATDTDIHATDSETIFDSNTDTDTGADTATDTDTGTGTETDLDSGPDTDFSDPLHIEAECAISPTSGDCDGLTGGFNSETYSPSLAMSIPACNQMNECSMIVYLATGTWLAFEAIDFTYYNSLTVHAASQNMTGSLVFRLDDPETGEIIGQVDTWTGSWTSFVAFTISVSEVDGSHTIYIIGGAGLANDYHGNIEWIELSTD